MLVVHGVLRHEVPQHHEVGMFLGRHLELDGRSLGYLAERVSQIKPAEWLAPIPTLNQGNLGSCTGNAGTRALAQYVQAQTGALNVQLDGLTLSGDPLKDEDFAVALYHEATIADGFPGEYPPDDNGSSGLGVCRALKKLGLIKSYVWATNALAWASLLQTGPTIIGMPWYSAWFHPDADGFIDSDPTWFASGVAGGHEVYVEALEAWDDNDLSKCIVRVHNSWGDSFGDHGCFRMRLSTYTRLQSQVDVKAFR